MASASDDFDRANGEIGANWTEDNGDIDIDTNVAVPQTADVFNRARYTATPMASSNHYSQADCARINGVSVRQASSADTCYTGRVHAYDQAQGYRLFKYVAGAETELDNATNNVESGAIRIRLTVNGASQVMTGRIFDGGWVEDQVVCSDTDGAIGTGLYAGIYGYHNLGDYNDWSAADLAAGRTTKNTDAFPLGQNHGTSFRF